MRALVVFAVKTLKCHIGLKSYSKVAWPLQARSQITEPVTQPGSISLIANVKQQNGKIRVTKADLFIYFRTGEAINPPTKAVLSVVSLKGRL